MKNKRNLFLIFAALLVIGAYQNCSPTGLSVTAPSSSAGDNSNGDQNSDQNSGPVTTSTVYKLGNPNLTAQPGQSVALALRFYGIPMNSNYQVFVHFVSSSGAQLPFGGDHSPSVPTSSWSGNVNYDRNITVPANTPAGTYSIRVGLYENVPPYLNRATLATGAGVTADGEKRYTVGQLTVSSSSTPVDPGPGSGSGSGPFGQDASQYVPTFSDEFNNGFNTAVWNDHIWYESSNPTKNYTVEDGKLKIWPQRDGSGNFFNRTIDTDGKYYQTYGYFEIDAKLPVGRGTWPAFWLFNHIGSRRPEMDVMEAYAGGAAPWGFDVNGIPHPQAYAPTVWKGDYDGQLVGTRQYDTGLDLSAGFHKYAVRWEPNRQIYYFDGKEVLTLNTTFPDPMYLMLDLWYGSASGTPNPTNTPEGKSNSFEVNYIRAWRFK